MLHSEDFLARSRSFDAARRAAVALVTLVGLLAIYSALFRASAAESTLAIINASISTAEDGPPISSETRFLPGDYVYLTFEIAGFAVQTENQGTTRKISLQYQIFAEDAEKRPLVEPASGEIETELSPEDKNWVPKRRASFVLPSFLAAGPFHLRAVVKDVFGKVSTERALPFAVGGVSLEPSVSIKIENFRFLRSEGDTEPLAVAAYAPGDTVYAGFELAGFRTGPDHRHHVAYGVTVLDPAGKAFIVDPHAADLDAGGYYPAQFVPGAVALKMGKNNAPGRYTVVVRARDLLAGQESETKQTFSIE